MLWTICFTYLCFVLTQAANESPEEYRNMAKADLDRAKAQVLNYNLAKNVVLMIGDGMGISTVTAARIYKGQQSGQSGEEYKLAFETFPHVGLSKTYNSDFQVADSAGTATALVSGYKAAKSTIGVDSRVTASADSCVDYDSKHDVTSILNYALKSGKSVGIVTTTRLTHATPAAAYAHSPFRYFESPYDMAHTKGCDGVKDIALQLIEDNPNIQVIMGGGRRNFLNSTTIDRALNGVDKHQRNGTSLEQMWQDHKQSNGYSHAYVETKGQFDAVDASSTDYLFGLFASDHMTYETDRKKGPDGEPSLSEMTEKAIQILSRNPKGFFLLVEGGRIDHGHHDNQAKRALVETDEFDNAVQVVQNLTNVKDTLTVVTADHSHVFSVSGYPSRGNDILGLVDYMPKGEDPDDNMPYTTLAYTNGPVVSRSNLTSSGRANLTDVDTRATTFGFPGCIQMPYETHGGEDVGIYAAGPMAHLFHSTHEQHYIAHVMMYASCLGDYSVPGACDLTSRLKKQKGIKDTQLCAAGGLGSSAVVTAVAVLLKFLLNGLM